ncbi:MAG: polyprenyl synthetase family protein [Proteobacteria bacterium]|nr:polyprenyl synthetase family protein [Pseudomonadota bacterium]
MAGNSDSGQGEEETALDLWVAGGARAFDSRLETLLLEGAGLRPPRLVAAMRHAVLAGGKRLRPFLVIESARMAGIVGEGPLQVAAALECVHCYSLVHDDLPAMDNDDMRRGQPTVHRAYDEATAILAGDALLTIAFTMMADHRVSPSAAVRLRLVTALAEASGVDGMVGGQMLDLAAEGRFGAKEQPEQGIAGVLAIQSRKTGALIRFAAEAGALLLPRGDAKRRGALRRYGEALGLAFQIRDDLIDHEGDSLTAGKATGKDTTAGKATFISLLGADGARRQLDAVTAAGLEALAPFGAEARGLAAVLHFNRTRQS